MELSVLVARIIAIVYLAAGIGALSGRISFKKIVENFESSQALTYLAGFMALMIGMILVHYHNIWVKDWIVLITVIGWLSLLKGIMLISCPQCISFFKSWYENTRIWGIFLIVVGLIFAYLGF